MTEAQKIIAMKVLTHANAKNPECCIDPATILIVVNIIMNSVRLLYACVKEETIPNWIKRPGRIQRYLLYREVRSSFRPEERKAVYQGLLETCANLSDYEVRELLSSV